jgi:hypothetical protein
MNKKEYPTFLRFLAWLFIGIIKVFAIVLAAPFCICLYIILMPIVDIGEAWERHEKARKEKGNYAER